MHKQQQIVELQNGGTRNCPSCDNDAARMRYENQSFKYGVGDETVELTARVPVWTCEACGDQYTDFVAEEIRHAEICRHLGRLTPKEIVHLRNRYEFTQSAFADLTGIGIASIKRWEAGNQIQNESFDKFMRLLFDSKNIEALRRPKMRIAQVPARDKFRTRLPPESFEQASAFPLRRTSVALALG